MPTTIPSADGSSDDHTTNSSKPLVSRDPDVPGADEDLLAELRAKTAKLAAQVHGADKVAKAHILDLDENKEKSPEFSVKIEHEDKIAEASIKPDVLAQGSDTAADLIREKLSKLYKKEPNAKEEARESIEAGPHRSKHQAFMYNLTTSGKSLADIQTEWHQYYVALPDDEKHLVWQEFYETQSQTSRYTSHVNAQKPPKITPANTEEAETKKRPAFQVRKTDEARTVKEVKEQLLNKVNANGKLTPAQHAKSLLFGLGLAAFVGLLVTFTFFNEVFIAPFISPSRNVSATPIIGSTSGEVGPEPKIIIPKINLEVPVVFDMTTINEDEVQKKLEDGVVHYASTPNPGETGNVSIVGHSSNNILNSGKYKFAFVLLKRLEVEDTFFVQKDGVRYTYKVYKKEIVSPDNTQVLQPQEKPNTITLITCDPPGTSLNRLIVVAEQISPDPSGNKPSTAIAEDVAPAELPSNAPSLWSRLWPF